MGPLRHAHQDQSPFTAKSLMGASWIPHPGSGGRTRRSGRSSRTLAHACTSGGPSVNGTLIDPLHLKNLRFRSVTRGIDPAAFPTHAVDLLV